MKDKIDFVLIWVDGGDIEWQKQRNQYAGKDPEDLADYRYRDWDNLKYWFRGVEKFAPWVNNIYFITCGHYPNWLNLNHPKLKFLKHEDYIPKEYLPTFNANTIELNFHRIKDLSEHFVYFNDDMFLINHVEKEDFFTDGKPKQLAGLEAIAMYNEIFGHILLNDIQLINRHFQIQDVISKNKKKWFDKGYGFKVLSKTFFLKNYCCFTSFANPHVANSLLKSTMEEVWEKEFELLDSTSKDKFRNAAHVNQYAFSWYDIAKGNFEPRKSKDVNCFTVENKNDSLLDAIVNQKYKMICVNDTTDDFDFEKVKNEVNNAFERILPEKSSFEL